MLIPAVGLLAILNLVPLGLLANDLNPVLSRFPRRSRTIAGVLVFFAGAAIPVALLIIGNGIAIASAVLVAIVLANLGVRHIIVRMPHIVT